MAIVVRRVYDPPEKTDGKRVLVDRYWPRGFRKEEAAIDEWLKELAPSPDLIKWFRHESGTWEGFKERYWAELDAHAQRDKLDSLREQGKSGTVTLLYASRNEEQNNALALAEYILR